MYLSGDLHRYPPLFVQVICERRQATPRCSRQNALGARNHLCSSVSLAVLVCCSDLLFWIVPFRVARAEFPRAGSLALGSKFARCRLDWKPRAIPVVFLFRLCGSLRCLFSHVLYLFVHRFLRGHPVCYLRLFQIFKLLQHGPRHSVTLFAAPSLCSNLQSACARRSGQFCSHFPRTSPTTSRCCSVPRRALRIRFRVPPNFDPASRIIGRSAQAISRCHSPSRRIVR